MPIPRMTNRGTERVGQTGRQKQDLTEQDISDHRRRHLDKRCSPETREMLLQLDVLVRGHFQIDGPYWHTKLYVAYWIDGWTWLAIDTAARHLKLCFLIKPRTFDTRQLAGCLGLAVYDQQAPRAEQRKLGSSVEIEHDTSNVDRVWIRAKPGYDFRNQAFLDFVRQAYDARRE